MKKASLLFILFILALPGCFDMPDDMTTPTWKAIYNIPVANRSYILMDEVNEDQYFQHDPDQEYIYLINYDTLAHQQSISDFISARLDQEYNNIDIPSLQLNGDIKIDFAEGIEMYEGIVTTGQIDIIIEAPSDGEVTFNLTMPAFKELNNINTWKPGDEFDTGDVAGATGTVPAGETKTTTIPLGGYYYDASEQEEKNKFLVVGNIQSTGSDAVAHIHIKNSMFRYVYGILQSLELDPIVTEFALPISEDVEKFRNSFHIYEPVMVLQAKYDAEFKKYVPDFDLITDVEIRDLYVKGYSPSGQSIDLTDETGEKNLGGKTIVSGNLDIQFDDSNSNLAEFLEFLPETVQVNAIAVMNPTNKETKATDQDTIRIKFDLNLQSKLSISDLRFTDTLEIDFDDDMRDEIRDKVDSLALVLELENQVPLGGNIKATFLNMNDQTLFFKNVSFYGAPVDDEGLSSGVKESRSEIIMNSNEAKLLGDAYNVELDMVFRTTDSSKAVIRGTDSVHVLSYGAVRLLMDLDDDDE